MDINDFKAGIVYRAMTARAAGPVKSAAWRPEFADSVRANENYREEPAADLRSIKEIASDFPGRHALPGYEIPWIGRRRIAFGRFVLMSTAVRAPGAETALPSKLGCRINTLQPNLTWTTVACDRPAVWVSSVKGGS
jgi:hypothetical protein